MSNQIDSETRRKQLEVYAHALLKPTTLSAVTAILLFICAALYSYVDRPLALYISDTISRPAHLLWRDITKVGDSIYYIPTAILLLVGGRTLMLWTAPKPIAQWYANLARLGLYALTSFATAGLIVHIIKRLLGRVRPKHLLSDNEYGLTFLTSDWSYNSFPSGHSQTAFVLATILTFFAPRYWWAFMTGAAVIAFSRVIINAHFLSDIIFGSFIGLVVALFVKFRWFDDITDLNYRPSHFYSPKPA